MAAVGYFLFAATLFMLDYSRKSLSTKIQVERANRLTVNTSSGCGMGTPNIQDKPPEELNIIGKKRQQLLLPFPNINTSYH